MAHPGCRHRDGQHPANVESHVPQPHVFVPGLDAEAKRHTAQHQRYQHQGHGQVQRAQNHAVGQRKRHQQHAHAQHQPGFIRIPERADAGDHRVLLFVVGLAQQNAHTQVVAVQNHISQHGQCHHLREDDRQLDRGLAKVVGQVRHVGSPYGGRCRGTGSGF